MKMNGKLLLLCLVQASVWDSMAFVAEVPKSLSFKDTERVNAQSPAFSYLGSLGGRDEPSTNVKVGTVNGPTERVSPMKTNSPAEAKALEQRLAFLENQLERSAATQRTASSSNLSAASKAILEKTAPVTVQGGSLKTWSYTSPFVERVQVVLKTEGRPLGADIQLWQGPDNTPHKMRVYVEDGSKRPFNAVIETPRGPNTIAIRNTGQLEFPLAAFVAANTVESGPVAVQKSAPMSAPLTIQGGALRTYPFEPSVKSVQVMLKTDGRPLNARIELLQGPNNNKQVIELYTEDGKDRPFYAIIETPGSGNVVRVVNTATVEFPLTAWVEAYDIADDKSALEPVLGGDSGGFMLDRQW